MPESRRWYTEPETFVAIAALIVSISAVVVGIYEASLQRHHDRAEVWPRLEIGTFTNGAKGASIIVENSGIGPAIVESAVITLDGKPQHGWGGIVEGIGGDSLGLSNYSISGHGLRPGDQITLVGIPAGGAPHPFWEAIARVGVTICYRSVFDERWIVESKRLGHGVKWRDVDSCAPQDTSADF